MIYETSIINPKKQLEFYKGLSEQLQQENQELKKQLEDYKKWYQDELEDNAELSDLWINRRARAIELENQQKEFIEYLEKNINHYKEIIKLDRENNTESDCRRFEARWTTYEEILLKYKEIIKENFYKSRKTIKERIRK